MGYSLFVLAIAAKFFGISRWPIAAAALVLSLCSLTSHAQSPPAAAKTQAALDALQTMLDEVAARSDSRFSLRPEVTEPQRALFLYIVSGDPADPAVENAYEVLSGSIDRQSVSVGSLRAYSWLAEPDDPEPRTTQVLLRLVANTNNCRAAEALRILVDQQGHFSRATDVTFLLQAMRTRPAECNGRQAEGLFRNLYGLDGFDEPVAAAMISAAEQTWGSEVSLTYRRLLSQNYFEQLDADELRVRVNNEQLSWPVREMAVDALARTMSEEQLMALVDDASYPRQLRLALVTNLGGVSVTYAPKRASRPVLERLASHPDPLIRKHFLGEVRTTNQGNGTEPLWDYLEAGIGPGSNARTRNIVLGKLNTFATGMEPEAQERALGIALTLLTDPDPTVRFNAIQALGVYAIEMRKLPPQLCELRDDPETVIREAAAYWLLLARHSALAPGDPAPDPNRCHRDHG